MKKYLVASLTMTVACIGFVHAQIISVPNSSFQTPAGTFSSSPYDQLGNANSTGASDPLTDWNMATNEAKGYGVYMTSALTSLGTSNGSQAAYLLVYNGANFETLSTASSLGAITANTMYTLTVAVGAPATWAGVPIGGAKTAGETGAEVILSLTGNGTAFANTTIAANLVPEGTLNDYTVTFTTGASGGVIGDTLGLSFEALKSSYPLNPDPGLEAAIFDNVRLTSTAPEPSTWVLMLGSLGVLVLLTRRNKPGDAVEPRR